MPTKYKSDFLNVLDQRGFIAQLSDPEGLDALAAARRITGSVGYDATATSIHIGNLITVTMLYWLQETGHRPISLMGGGTSMVGDPSFRDDQRQLLSPEKIKANIESIKKVYARILRFGDGPTDAIMVDNAAWLLELKYVDSARCRPAFVNRMLSFDSVKSHREQSLSFELTTWSCRADFVGLTAATAASRWAAPTSGATSSTASTSATAWAARSSTATPLLTTASGQKMGKTATGAVGSARPLLALRLLAVFEHRGRRRRPLHSGFRLPLSEIARLETLAGAELNEARRSSPPRPPPSSTAATTPSRRQTAAATFEAGASTCRCHRRRGERSRRRPRHPECAGPRRPAASNGEARRHISPAP